MLSLKKLSAEAIPEALEKAKQYRLLNDPWQAESICRDILETDPDNQDTVPTLILAITDQFQANLNHFREALDLIPHLKAKYQQHYFSGLIHERRAVAALKKTSPRAAYIAYEHLREAMEWYEKADSLDHPDKNEEAVLRYNACVRMITQRKLRPAPEEQGVQPFLE